MRFGLCAIDWEAARAWAENECLRENLFAGRIVQALTIRVGVGRVTRPQFIALTERILRGVRAV
jgi:hypothetical protein